MEHRAKQLTYCTVCVYIRYGYQMIFSATGLVA